MNKTTEALKLAEEALDLAQALLEKSYHHSTILNAYKETRKYREALAEQEKQEPVAWTNYNGAVNNRLKNPAPVDAKAIREERDSMWLAQMVFEEKRVRAEALEEAAKVCDDYDMDHIVGQQLAAAIRSLK